MRDEGMAKVVDSEGCVNLEASGEMSALQLGCECLGPARAAWAAVPPAISTHCFPKPRPQEGGPPCTLYLSVRRCRDLFPVVSCVIVYLPRAIAGHTEQVPVQHTDPQ